MTENAPGKVPIPTSSTAESDPITKDIDQIEKRTKDLLKRTVTLEKLLSAKRVLKILENKYYTI